MKKGYFSHLYKTEDNNILESRKHLTHLPDPSYYDINNMHKKAIEMFLQWYKIHKEEPFHMDRQLLEYCHSDMDILLNACWKFRKLFMDITGPHHPIDPFDYITIASSCMGTFHAKFLPEQCWYCTRMQETTACIGYGTASVQVKARKLHEVYMGDRSWAEVDWDDVAIHHFVKSPIGLIPPHGYARRDNYSMHPMEWILLEEKIL